MKFLELVLKKKEIKYNYVVLKYVFKFCPGFIYYSLLNVIAVVVKTLSKVLLISEAIKFTSSIVSNKLQIETCSP